MKKKFKLYKELNIRYINKTINNSNGHFTLKILAIFVFLLAASIATIVYSANIKNSKHDLSYLLTKNTMGNAYNQYGEVCVYCHTPHGGDTGSTAPLWNRNNPAGPYNVYNSATMDSVPSNPPSGISLACLGCHDGTIAVDAIINAHGSGANLSGPWYGNSEATAHYKMGQAVRAGSCAFCHNPGGTAADHRAAYLNDNLSVSGTPVDLTNDHPISMTYPTDQPTQFNSVSNGKVGTLPLYSGKVECSSCHNVHSPDNVPFLRSSNSVSALCTTCHIK